MKQMLKNVFLKKLILTVMFIIVLALTVAGCNSPTQQLDTSNQSDMETELEIEAYRPPAEFIKIDMTSNDPSTDSIQFQYDELGRVSQCYYKIDNEDIYLSYSYEGTQIQIYGFSGTIVVEDKKLEAKGEFDASLGFVEHEGYYFKGFSF